jgi:hypothetical protein
MLPWETIAFVRWEASGASAWYAVYGHDGTCLTTMSTKTTPNEIVFQTIMARMGKLADSAEERSLGATIAAAVRRLLQRR